MCWFNISPMVFFWIIATFYFFFIISAWSKRSNWVFRKQRCWRPIPQMEVDSIKLQWLHFFWKPLDNLRSKSSSCLNHFCEKSSRFKNPNHHDRHICLTTCESNVHHVWIIVWTLFCDLQIKSMFETVFKTLWTLNQIIIMLESLFEKS